jgi:hypothetical protein
MHSEHVSLDVLEHLEREDQETAMALPFPLPAPSQAEVFGYVVVDGRLLQRAPSPDKL